jgi:polyhydroxyalkanoate synthesis regulator phasin
MLKKGILLGLGLKDTNKKHIKDFVDDLYKKGYVGYEEAEELFKTLVEKARSQRDSTKSHIEEQIKNYIKEYDELIYEHLLYLERRVEQLEDEIERMQLEKELENMSDEDLEKLISEFEADLPKGKKSKKEVEQDKIITDIINHDHDVDDKKLEEILFGDDGKHTVKVKVKAKKGKKVKKKKAKKAKKKKVKTIKAMAPQIIKAKKKKIKKAKKAKVKKVKKGKKSKKKKAKTQTKKIVSNKDSNIIINVNTDVTSENKPLAKKVTIKKAKKAKKAKAPKVKKKKAKKAKRSKKSKKSKPTTKSYKKTVETIEEVS